MKIAQRILSDVVEIAPTRHGDTRGHFAETFRADWFLTNVADVAFVQDNESLSAVPGTIRGIHFQTGDAAQGKLVRCTQGAIFDVAVDLRHGSLDYGRWVAVELSAERGNQLWIPVGFGHGFCTLEPNTVVSYKVTAYYSAVDDAGVRWDDADIAIAWPNIADPETLSAKDRALPALHDLPAHFTVGG